MESNKKVRKLLGQRKKFKKKLKHIDQLLLKYNYYDDDELNNLNDLTFKQVRKNYFNRLQQELEKNVRLNAYANAHIKIEEFSLKMEQQALIRCMQKHAYQQSMAEIIAALRDYTQNGELHPLVRAESGPIFPKMENYQETPMTMTHEARPSPTPVALVPPTPNVTRKTHLEDLTEVQKAKPVSRVQPHTVSEKPEANGPEVEPGLEDFISRTKPEPLAVDATNCEQDKPELNVESHEQDELNVECLMQILEGSDDEENDQTDEKIGKMEQLFGNEEEKNVENKKIPQQHPSQKSCIKIWQNERYISMYKMFNRCKQMPPAKFFKIRKTFSNLFGDDNDFDDEESFSDIEKYLTCCSRRILPIVGKHVMPYYKERRICGGSYIFKNLVRRIADSLIDINDYPDEKTIHDFVEKFFPGTRKYMNVIDVWSFTLDEEFI